MNLHFFKHKNISEKQHLMYTSLISQQTLNSYISSLPHSHILTPLSSFHSVHKNPNLNSMASPGDQFFTPEHSYSTDQVFNMVAEHNTQHANVSDQQQLFEFGSDHSGDGSEGVGAGRISGETEKKKRGRPKRYSLLHGQNVDGNSDAGDDGSGGSDLESGKRERGRPASSLKKQMEALGPPGVGFTPHVIIIEQGEDLVSKLVSFSKEGARTVCILTATGVISSVTLQQSPVFGGATTYEGLFEILSLSGSFVPSESDGTINTTGLSVSLACAEGRVVGGAVAGMLVAASPIQVIVGSFIADGKKPKPKASSNSSESGRSLIDMPSPRYSSFGRPSCAGNTPPN